MVDNRSDSTAAVLPRPRVAELTPGYFALVMASGIISLGLELLGLSTVSRVLWVIAAAAYLVLIGLNGWRLAAARLEMGRDLRDPRRGFGFFTFVAATNVLAARCAAAGWYLPAKVLFVIGLTAWLVLGYLIPWIAVLGRTERPVVASANGSWFVWVVASQSVAVVAATLEPVWAGLRPGLAVIAVLSWSVGVFLYAAAAMLVALRLLLYPLTPQEFDPQYWVSMGAVAITVVAGSRIVEMESTPMVDATRGLVAGLSVVFWAFATWLIPVLIAAGVWRHAARRIPLRYVPTLWSMVFPLGMYSVAGIYLGRADSLPLVAWIGSAWMWVAAPVWALVFLAMVRDIAKALSR